MSLISAAPAPQTLATLPALRQADDEASGEPGDFATLLWALQATGPAESKAADAPASSLVGVPAIDPTGWQLPAVPAADIFLHPAIEPPLAPAVEGLSDDGPVLDLLAPAEAIVDTVPINDTASPVSVAPIPIPIATPAAPAVNPTPEATATGAPTRPLTTDPLLPLAAASASTTAASSDGTTPVPDQLSEPVRVPHAPAPGHSSAVQIPGTPITGDLPHTVAGASVRSISPLTDLPPTTESAAAPAVTAVTVAAGVTAQPVAVLVPATPQAPPAGPQAPPAPLATQLASPLFTLVGSRAGEHLMTIQVTPDSLGPLTVRAVIGVDDIRIELFAPTDAAREAVRLILTDLRRDLAGGGLAASLDLSGKNAPEERRENQPHDGSPRNGAPPAEHISTPRQSAEPSQVSTMTLDITV